MTTCMTSHVRGVNLSVALYTKLNKLYGREFAVDYEGEIRQLGDSIRVRQPHGIMAIDQMFVVPEDLSNDDIVLLWAHKLSENARTAFAGVIKIDSGRVCLLFGDTVRKDILTKGSTLEEFIAAFTALQKRVDKLSKKIGCA